MEVVKKNLLSIICAVVALLAVIASYWPLGGKFEDLQAKVDDRAGKEITLRNIVKKQRELPIADASGLPIVLKEIPNKATIDLVRNKIKSVLVNQAHDLEETALTLNKAQHTLLTPNSLPRPDGSAPFNFQNDLAAALGRLKTDLGGCMPPAPETIEKAIVELRALEDKKLQGIAGQATNQEFVDKEFAELASRKPDEMRLETARTHKLYILPGALDPDPSVADKAKPPIPDQIWYAQVGYWVQQDVCSAIGATNASSNSIIDSPVKTLVRLDLPVSVALYQLPFGTDARRMNSGTGAAPSTAGKADDPVAPIPTISPTGRACNPLYDVVLFNLSVNIDARQVQVFLRNLSVNKYIAVRQLNMSRLDLDDENSVAGFAGRRGAGADNGPASGFIYGQGVPVARLDLQCEALFLRSWTQPLMPEQVLRDLLIAAPAARHPR